MLFSVRYSSIAVSIIPAFRLSVALPAKAKTSLSGKLLRSVQLVTAVLFSVIVPVLSSSNKFKLAASWIPVKSEVKTPSLLKRVASNELDKAKVDGIATGIEAINIIARNGNMLMKVSKLPPLKNEAMMITNVSTPSSRQR